MRGEDVRTLQIALAARFPSLHLQPDGIFGTNTDKAVKKFQKSVGLGWTVTSARPPGPRSASADHGHSGRELRAPDRRRVIER